MELRNKLKSFIYILFSFGIIQTSSAVEVGTFDEFKSAYSNSSTTEIILNSDITATSNLDYFVSNDLIINGNSNNFIGNGYSGIQSNTNKTLSLKDITFNNFKQSGNGGAISNDADSSGSVTINTIENVTFENNSATNGSGGAISNYAGSSGSATINLIDTVTFENNSAYDYGGAISNDARNSGSSVTIDSISNSTFSGNSASYYGGAIYNSANSSGSATIDSISNSTFVGNSATGAYGGAIYNYANSSGSATINLIDTVTFENNSAYYHGGAIYNYAGSSGSSAIIGTISNSTFSGNSVYDYGGAIYNSANSSGGSVTINLIDTVTFENNTARYGGAISNDAYYSGSSVIIGTISNSSFSGNSAESGGAIYNSVYSSGSATIDSISNSTFSGNSATNGSGGAIYNYADSSGSVTINLIDAVTFENNTASYSGGAIFNVGGYIGYIDNTTFIGNSVTAIGEEVSAYGGAIANGSYIGYIDNTTFIGNSVTAIGEEVSAYGGAIFNAGGYIGYIDNTTFINNSAATSGGAIYNVGSKINIIASLGNTEFTGNTANNISNAIHNEAGVINLNSLDDKKIIINDGITGLNGTLNINSSNIDISSAQDGSEFAPTNGTIILANEIDGNTVNFYDGKLILTHHTYTQDESLILAGQTGVANFTSNSALNIYGGHISTQDNAIYNHHLGNVTLHSDITMSIDANLANKTMDTITFDTFNNPNNSIIDIQNINILKPTTDTDFTLSPFGNIEQAINSNLASSVKYSGGEIVYSPIYKYGVEYDNQTGLFNFKTTYTPQSPKYEDVNPAVVSSAVAAQSGSVATQVATFTEAFYHMDTFMTRDVSERIMMRDKNKYASSYQQGMLWDDAVSRRDNREAWYRPYVTIESVPLKNGPKVDNVAYGTYFGTNSPIKHLKKGWDASWGVFFGYNGSKQSYDSVDTRQNGATMGLVGELYKKNFFTGLSINAGASMGKADTMYGSDDFNTWVGGIASKTGYNFEFKNGRYIVQPTLLLGYSFIKTIDFTNSAGVKISSEPIHSIHLEPGVKVISPRKNGWRPYAHFSVIWNILDKAKIKANDMPLPETSIKPYVKYGVGVQKNWTDRMTSFLQTYLTHGGRNGIGFQLGFSWLF